MTAADGHALTRLMAHEMAAGLRRGDFSARELLDAHLDVATRTDHGLHAWMFLDEERARAKAAQADARLADARAAGDGALGGVPRR